MSSRWVKIGIVGKAHGLRGAFFISGRDIELPQEVKEISIGAEGSGRNCFRVVTSRMQSGRPLIQVEQIDVKEKVKEFIGQPIWARRVAFDVQKDEYMWHDVVGKKVFDASQNEVGTIVGIDNYGAADIVVIESDKGFLPVSFVSAYFDMSFKRKDETIKMIVDLDVFDESWELKKVRRISFFDDSS